MNENERIALKKALASDWIENFSVTEQTVSDCEQLLTKQISVADMVQKILPR